MKELDVVGAVIVDGGRIYCTQRGSGSLAGYWEFPGGKVEGGESPQQALAREIEEELGCRVAVGEKIITTRHEYEFAIVSLTTFYCALLEGAPRISEHRDSVWLTADALGSLTWAPADIPAVQHVQEDLVP